jgi:hypothetical protein
MVKEDNTISDRLRNNISAYLSRAKLTIHSLEKKAALKTGSVQNIMNGRSKNPGIEAISRIAAAMDCTLEALVNGTIEDIMREHPTRIFSIVPSSPNLSEKDTIDFAKVDFDPVVYKDLTDYVSDNISKSGITISVQAAYYCIDEVYRYALANNTLDKQQLYMSFMRAFNKVIHITMLNNEKKVASGQK